MKSVFDLLDKFNMKYDDLNSAERETLERWMGQMATAELTVERIKEHIGAMKDSVEQELAAYDIPKEKDLLLKARLRNYLMFQAFLTGPEKAKKFLEQSIQNIKK